MFLSIFSATQIRSKILSARTAATQINSHKNKKKTEHKKTEVLLHNIYGRFASTVFEIVAQHRSTLTILDALHLARCQKLVMGAVSGGLEVLPSALEIFLQK